MTRRIPFLFLLLGLYFTVSSQNITPTFESELIKPCKVLKINENHYFIDFGKAYFGTIYLNPKSSQSDSLIVHVGEKLDLPNSIDRNPSGEIRYQKIVLPNLNELKPISLTLKENLRNTTPPAVLLPDSFGIIMPFRYCEIENLRIPITDLDIRQKAFYYHFNDSASSFLSSDTILNKVWDLCKHTIKATSFAGYYIDGDRERIPYEADAFINQLSHYSVDSVYSLARRTNEYFMENPTWPTEWILQTAFMFYYDYLYTGDTKPIIKNYDKLKVKSLIQLEREDGLITTKSDKLNDGLMKALGFADPKKRIKDIVDWPIAERDYYEMADVNTVVNAFYYQNLLLMAKIAGAINKYEDSIFFSSKAEKVKQVINAKLIDKTTGLYVDGIGSSHSSLHANMYPLAFDLVPEENLKEVIDFIKSKGMKCSVYGAQYLLEGLCKNNETEYALDLITNTEGDRNWYNMIRSGSTITLEAWDRKYKPNLDWNHAWATAPANIIVRYIWGITPGTPGFNEIKIHPRLNYLHYSEIKVPTINGCVFAEYINDNVKGQVFRIDVPSNTKATFYITGKPYRIKLNDKIVDIFDDYLVLYNGKNIIELKY